MRDIGAQNNNWCFSWCQTHFCRRISGSAEVLPIPLDREIWSSQRPCDAGVGGESGGARHFQRFHQVTHNTGCLPTRVTTRGNRRESIPLEDCRGNAGETSPSLQMGLNYGRGENHYLFIMCRWFFLWGVQITIVKSWSVMIEHRKMDRFLTVSCVVLRFCESTSTAWFSKTHREAACENHRSISTCYRWNVISSEDFTRTWWDLDQTQHNLEVAKQLGWVHTQLANWTCPVLFSLIDINSLTTVLPYLLGLAISWEPTWPRLQGDEQIDPHLWVGAVLRSQRSQRSQHRGAHGLGAVLLWLPQRSRREPRGEMAIQSALW